MVRRRVAPSRTMWPDRCLKSEVDTRSGLPVPDAVRASAMRCAASGARSLIQLLAALGHGIEKRAGLAVEKLHVGGNGAAGGGVAGHRARADRHHLDVGDVLAGLLRLEFGIEQVLGAGEYQRPGLDRSQRLGGVAVESGRGADIVPLIGPGLVNPVVGVER